MKATYLTTLLAAVLAAATVTEAATVTWNSGVITDENDVVTAGTTVYAFSFGNPNQATPSGQTPGSPVIKGITFTSLQASNATQVTSGDFTISLRSSSGSTRFTNTGNAQLPSNSAGLTGEYEKLISTAYTHSAGNANGGTNSYLMTFNNLTAGHTYIAQFWTNSSTEIINPDKTFKNEGDASDPGIVASSNNKAPENDGLGSWVTAEFVADDTGSITISMTGTYYSKINAVQLRDLGAIPEPATATLAFLAGAGLFFRRRR